MSYFNEQESRKRIQKVKELLAAKGLDAAIVYYDELNIANGWYLTGWCPQFEKGAVLIPIHGEPMLLGGPESEPFAKMNSAITNTRCFPVFMVPDEEYPNAAIIDFGVLNEQLREAGTVIRRLGFVGTATIPHQVYTQLEDGFAGVEFVDITEAFEIFRAHKSPWEIQCMEEAAKMCDAAYEKMKAKIGPGVYEYEIAAEGEYICRSAGANSFAYGTIVGSGQRCNAVVPTALNKRMAQGELVMFGIAPRYMGYANTFGDTLPVSGAFTPQQRDGMMHLRETFRLTKEQLKPGKCGQEIDAAGRAYFEKNNLMDYLVCPFAHTIGLMEAEAPFYGPGSKDVLEPGMAVMVDISFFGHPTLYGARIETGYVITETGCRPFSPKMDAYFMNDIK